MLKKALNKTNLGLQKSTNESAWGRGVELGTAGPGLTSTSSEEQRRSRIRVRLKATRTGRQVHSEQRVKGAGFWAMYSRFNA